MDRYIQKKVIDNIKLVHYVAKKYRGLDCYEDLIQEGTIGLIDAAQKFNSSTGFAFSSFAAPHIRGKILHYLRDRANIIRQKRGEKKFDVISLDLPVGDPEGSCTRLDLIPSTLAPSDEQLDSIKEFIKTLPEGEQLLMGMKLNGAKNKVIAEKLGVSPVTVTRHLERLISLAQEWIEGFRSEIPAILKPQTKKQYITAQAEIELPISKWKKLRSDVEKVFTVYQKHKNWAAIERCVDKLYRFGRLALQRKYWHLESNDLDNIISWEDLLHDAIIKLRQMLINNEIQSAEHLVAMLYVRAKYSYWRLLAQSAKYVSINKPIKDENYTTLEDFICSTLSEKTPDRIEDIEAIYMALSKLPTIDRQIIKLAWIQGMTPQQIAIELNKTIPSISRSIQKSRVRVAKILAGEKMNLGYC